MSISRAEARAKVPDAPALYKALTRNGYKLPPQKDPIITIKFMKGKSSKSTVLCVTCILCFSVLRLFSCMDFKFRALSSFFTSYSFMSSSSFFI